MLSVTASLKHYTYHQCVAVAWHTRGLLIVTLGNQKWHSDIGQGNLASGGATSALFDIIRLLARFGADSTGERRKPAVGGGMQFNYLINLHRRTDPSGVLSMVSILV